MTKVSLNLPALIHASIRSKTYKMRPAVAAILDIFKIPQAIKANMNESIKANFEKPKMPNAANIPVATEQRAAAINPL